jgi:hypothetical protein
LISIYEQVYDNGMFEELGTAIDELDIPVDGAALAAVLALRDRLDARISDAVATHDRAALWELDGATSMTAWLADRAAMPRAHPPVTAGAWRDGALSSGQVEAIAANLDPDTLALFADHEAVMVPTLVDLSVRDVASTMAAWRECATVDRDPKPEPVQALYLSRTLGGRWRLDANLGPETGELLATALRLAQSPDVEGEPARSPATRRADSLGDICRHFLDHQHACRGGRHRPHLNLVLDITATGPCAPPALPASTAPTSTAPAPTGCSATPPYTGSSATAVPPSWTTAPPPAPSPPPSTTPSSSATTTADSPAATAPPPGAKATTSDPGKPAAPPSWPTSYCCAAATTTSSMHRGGTPSSSPTPRSRSPTPPDESTPPPHQQAGPHPYRSGNDDTPGAFPSTRPREIRMPIAVPTLACTAGG